MPWGLGKGLNQTPMPWEAGPSHGHLSRRLQGPRPSASTTTGPGLSALLGEQGRMPGGLWSVCSLPRVSSVTAAPSGLRGSTPLSPTPGLGGQASQLLVHFLCLHPPEAELPPSELFRGPCQFWALRLGVRENPKQLKPGTESRAAMPGEPAVFRDLPLKEAFSKRGARLRNYSPQPPATWSSCLPVPLHSPASL